MTRYTNVALKKRPYVEAGFNYREEPEMPEASTSNTAPQNTAEAGSSTLEQTVAPKKKRKRGKSRKPSTITDGGAEGTETTAAAEDRGGGAVQPSDGTVGNSPVRSKTTNTKADKGKKKLKEKSRGALSTCKLHDWDL
ncbi:hypothetical protein PHLCEN_2v619 [Hermanssonia centrifuga]|uniref:Uncharacterized protein n=1 Tax=Hermanssonia centrifuga TaxID=98765 RepID=A0A2R6S5L2_9APHY|nr:hypothetical protein PHLCEN_2v619 [Hermanssonia centrifuga]